MTSILPSIVESYMYADMYNRDYDGGSGTLDRVQVGGVSVDHILPSINNKDGYKGHENDLHDGGNRKCNGPFTDKVVPVGLVFISIQKDPDVEYEEHIYPGVNREVISDSLYDKLIGSVLLEKRRNKTPPKRRSSETLFSRSKQDKTRKRK
jgi:hypothetical protein